MIQKRKLNKEQKRNRVVLGAFLVFIFGIILYNNFNKYIEQSSFYSFKNSLLVFFKILFGSMSDVIILIIGLGFAIGGFAIFYTWLYKPFLNFIPIVRNKFLKLFFLKFFHSKPIAKKFILENKKEISKFHTLKNFNNRQIIDLFKDILVSTYKESISPLPFNVKHGGLRKLNDNYFRDPSLVDLKFNFIKTGEASMSSFQKEEEDIIKKYIYFCKDAIFDNYMQHKMKLSTEPFEKIASGAKVIESRLYDEKRQQIVLGDEIEFSENNNPQNKVRTRVVGLLRYQSFESLFTDHEPYLFGEESKKFLLNQIKQFYSTEDEQRYGVVGIRIEVID